ncbi:MAG TPA: cytochrome c [Steroidobacteraceae bacterium]|nr:cytochrome c [Steroidobacteraceae bacterium]
MSRGKQFGMVAALAGLAAFAGVHAATVAGSEADAGKAIEARQAVFKQIKDLWDPLTKMLTHKTPVDPALIATNAAKIQELAGRIPAQFTVDTRNFKGTKTNALDGIWGSEADFKAKADALGTAAGELVTAAKGGDTGTIQKSLIAVGKSCGSCHDSYRAKVD